MIFDLIQAREAGEGAGDYVGAIQARQVVNCILATSSEHAGCFLAMRYGLARAKAGHVSVQLLAKVTGLSRVRCEEIVQDMREIIVRSNGI